MDADLRAALLRVERANNPQVDAAMLEQQSGTGDYGVEGARALWLDDDGNAVIYGYGGGARYLIGHDGEVTYSRSDQPSGVAAAEAEGFRVT